MSEKSFNEYRSKDVKHEDDEMEVDQPVKERKWYKHVYKGSQRKGNLRQHKSGSNQRNNQQKGNLDERKPLMDLRSRTIDRNRRDAQLQKEYNA